jgi:hypothetical protein
VGDRITIRVATPSDAEDLAAHMREDDRLEISAGSGEDPRDSIAWGLRHGEAWSAVVGGRVLATWGVVPTERGSALDERVGVGWLLTSTLVERHRLAFWRGCQLELYRLLGTWDVLVNAIDARHTRALRWAKRLGFRLLDVAPHGASGMPFVPFSVRMEDLRV